MNNTHKHFGFGYGVTALVAVVIAVLGMLMGLTPAAEAQPAGLLPRALVLPSSTLTSNQTVTATVHHWVDVPPGCIAYLQPAMVAGAGTSNVVFSFNQSLDDIVSTPTPLLTATVALTGTNALAPIVALG